MAEPSFLSLTVEAWAIITIKRWQNKIEQLGIGHSNDLARSFMQHVITQGNGDPVKIEFAFNYYGKFVDMGVGNGVKKTQVGINNRIAKPWYSATFYHEVKRLGELLAEKFAIAAQTSILNSVSINGRAPDGASGRSKVMGNKEYRPATENKTSSDIATGNKKITWKQFQENRKRNGW